MSFRDTNQNKAGLLSVLFFAALILVSCGPSHEAPPGASGAASTGEIGVAECDEYLAKVETCINERVPEDAKAMQRQSIEQVRNQWRQAATDATARAGLATGCKAALDSARSAMAAYGCEW
jgi:hypothetical protein